MAPPKPSTDASNTYAAPPSGSVTSPTTSPEHSSKPEDSDPNYTPNYEEPLSQEKLAERTTLHWSYIGQVERGQRNLSLHSILRIAHAQDTDAGGLVSGLEV
ncbi:hypothetical protein ACTODO_00038 [Schaalia dentiphila ATCC 17982]|uniref:HTH cro/C1-type domain-containing protein n=2 Tax=Schaalia TaxID=2529408 RepID=A7B8T9_9ACTO|nr:hypothetical protein ACTODO_00038 [Schaalia odontolytica ATCC 17982]